MWPRQLTGEDFLDTLGDLGEAAAICCRSARPPLRIEMMLDGLAHQLRNRDVVPCCCESQASMEFRREPDSPLNHVGQRIQCMSSLWCLPQCACWERPQPIAEPNRELPAVQDDARMEAVSQAITEPTKMLGIIDARGRGGLDLDPHETAASFEQYIHLVARLVAEVVHERHIGTGFEMRQQF